MWKVFADSSVPVRRAEPVAVGINVMGGFSAYAMADRVVVCARHCASSAHDMLVRRRGGLAEFRAAARSMMRTS